MEEIKNRRIRGSLTVAGKQEMTLNEKKQEAISQMEDLRDAINDYLKDMANKEKQQEIYFYMAVTRNKALRFTENIKRIRDAELTGEDNES